MRNFIVALTVVCALHNLQCVKSLLSVKCIKCNVHKYGNNPVSTFEKCKNLHQTRTCVYAETTDHSIPKSVLEIPSRPADNLNVDYYLKKWNGSNGTEVAITINWMQQDICNVTGFYFRFQYGNFVYLRIEVRFNLSNSPSFKKKCKKSPSTAIQFDMSVYGRNYFDPGENYYLNLLTLPSYVLMSKIKDCETEFSIPGCRNKEIANTGYCKRLKAYTKKENKRKQERKKTEHKQILRQNKSGTKKQKVHNDFSSILIVPASAIGSVVILIFIGLGAYCFKTLQNAYKGLDLSTLLIYVDQDETNENYLDASNIVATMLGRPCFNLWNQSKTNNPNIWIQDHLEQCKHVLLIITPQGKLSWNMHVYYNENNRSEKCIVSDDMKNHVALKDHCNFCTGSLLKSSSNSFALMIQKLSEKHCKVDVSLIYFDASCLAVKLARNFKRAKCFQLPENIGNLLKYVTGENLYDEKFSCRLELLKSKVEKIRNGQSAVTVPSFGEDELVIEVL